MKSTEFSYYLTSFFTKFLTRETEVSKNTIASYRDTFILFLRFLRDEKQIPADQLTLDMITKNLVVEYLDWIENKRRCSTSTRNVRRAAMLSFFKYLQYESPNLEWQKILSIPVKKTEKKTLNYLTLDGVKLLLKMPDLNTKIGRRDLALLTLIYDTGAKVQEIIDLTPSMVRLDIPYSIKLPGKGSKTRVIPLMDPTMAILKRYMEEHDLFSSNLCPLFFNNRKGKLTRGGVHYILTKYKNLARKENKLLIPEVLSCQSLRHSKAMHLLQSGVNLVQIRDILGHCSVRVTEIYAKANKEVI